MYPKLDTYFYKKLLVPSSKDQPIALAGSLLNDASLKDLVTKYAQDQKAYHEALGKTMIKLSLLGHQDEPIKHIEHLLEDHPYEKMLFPFY